MSEIKKMSSRKINGSATFNIPAYDFNDKFQIYNINNNVESIDLYTKNDSGNVINAKYPISNDAQEQLDSIDNGIKILEDIEEQIKKTIEFNNQYIKIEEDSSNVYVNFLSTPLNGNFNYNGVDEEYFIKGLNLLGIEEDENISLEEIEKNRKAGKYLDYIFSQANVELDNNWCSEYNDIVYKNIIDILKVSVSTTDNYDFENLCYTAFNISSFDIGDTRYTLKNSTKLSELGLDSNPKYNDICDLSWIDYASYLGYSVEDLETLATVYKNNGDTDLSLFQNDLKDEFYTTLMNYYLEPETVQEIKSLMLNYTLGYYSLSYDQKIYNKSGQEVDLASYLIGWDKDFNSSTSIQYNIESDLNPNVMYDLKNLTPEQKEELFTCSVLTIILNGLKDKKDYADKNWIYSLCNNNNKNLYKQITLLSNDEWKVSSQKAIENVIDYFYNKQNALLYENLANVRTSIRELTIEKDNIILMTYVDADFENLNKEFIKSEYESIYNDIVGNYKNLLNEEEKSYFIYFLNKYGEVDGRTYADNYFKIKEEELNSRRGYFDALKYVAEDICGIETYENISDYALLTSDQIIALNNEVRIQIQVQKHSFDGFSKALNMIDSHIKGIGDGTEALILNTVGLFNGDAYDGILPANTFEMMNISQMLSGNKFLEKSYEYGAAIGRMLIPVTASTIAYFTGHPVIGAFIADTLMGASVFGETFDTTIRDGYSFRQAMAYSSLSGSSEFLSDLLLSGIPGLSLMPEGTVGSLFKEAAQESIQEAFDFYIRSKILGDGTATMDNFWQAGIDGFIVALLMNDGHLTLNGVSVVFSDVKNYISLNYEDIRTLTEYMADPDISDYDKVISIFKMGNTPGLDYNVFTEKNITVNEVVDIIKDPTKSGQFMNNFDLYSESVFKGIEITDYIAAINQIYDYVIKTGDENVFGFTKYELSKIKSIIDNKNDIIEISNISNDILDYKFENKPLTERQIKFIRASVGDYVSSDEKVMKAYLYQKSFIEFIDYETNNLFAKETDSNNIEYTLYGTNEEALTKNLVLAQDYYNLLPDELKGNIKSIEIFDCESFDNEAARFDYNRKNMKVAADALDGRIRIFYNGHSDYLSYDTYLHEVAHLFDEHLGNGKHWSDTMVFWDNAMKEDNKNYSKARLQAPNFVDDSGIMHPTEYAKTKTVEDFAESVTLYFLDPDSFRKLFPNRAAALDTVFYSTTITINS